MPNVFCRPGADIFGILVTFDVFDEDAYEEIRGRNEGKAAATGLYNVLSLVGVLTGVTGGETSNGPVGGDAVINYWLMRRPIAGARNARLYG